MKTTISLQQFIDAFTAEDSKWSYQGLEILFDFIEADDDFKNIESNIYVPDLLEQWCESTAQQVIDKYSLEVMHPAVYLYKPAYIPIVDAVLPFLSDNTVFLGKTDRYNYSRREFSKEPTYVYKSF